MPRKIAIANRKGGSGKTTTAVNLAAALAIRGERTLLVDLDSQANATLSLGFDIENVTPTIYELLLGGETDTTQAIRSTVVPGLDLIPAAPRLAGAEIELVPVPGREQLLGPILDQVTDNYDFVLADCPVGFGLLTLNTFVAFDEVLAPVQTHHLSVVAIRQLSDIIRRVNRSLNPSLRLVGLVPTMVDRRMKISKSLIEEMERKHGKNLLRPSIRLDARLAETPASGKPIQLFAPKSNGAYDYTVLADDLRVM